MTRRPRCGRKDIWVKYEHRTCQAMLVIVFLRHFHNSFPIVTAILRVRQKLFDTRVSVLWVPVESREKSKSSELEQTFYLGKWLGFK